jgi:hypothetical protein
MQVEIMAGLGAARLVEVALGLTASIRETIFSRTFFPVLPVGSFAGRPKIDDFSHAWS